MQKSIIDKIEKYCIDKKLINKGDKIVLGLSGGADSVFLLWALKELSKKWSLELYAVHINHGIRGEEAKRDEEYSVNLALKYGIECEVFRKNIPDMAKEEGLTEEEAGRIYRYECFERVRKEKNYDSIAVAHHMDDQAETIIFQMLRGSSLKGMGGIKPRRDKIIRPLLCVEKKDIVDFLNENRIMFCQDKTNDEVIYHRNKIRHEVLPIFESIQKKSAYHICKTGEDLQEVFDFVLKSADEIYDKNVIFGKNFREISYSVFANLHRVIGREIIMRMIGELAGRKKDITSSHIEMVYNIFMGETGKKCDLPYDLTGRKDYDRLTIVRNQNISFADNDIKEKICFGKKYVFSVGNSRKMSISFQLDSSEKIILSDIKKYCTKCFDYDKMKFMPRLRFPKPGDYFWLDEKGKKKKLSRFFQDSKIAVEKRKKIIVLACDDHVIWIPELNRVSAYYYIDSNTKNILKGFLSIEDNI